LKRIILRVNYTTLFVATTRTIRNTTIIMSASVFIKKQQQQQQSENAPPNNNIQSTSEAQRGPLVKQSLDLSAFATKQKIPERNREPYINRQSSIRSSPLRSSKPLRSSPIRMRSNSLKSSPRKPLTLHIPNQMIHRQSSPRTVRSRRIHKLVTSHNDRVQITDTISVYYTCPTNNCNNNSTIIE
jgi:hypothetical protein